jgi:hypothetical protein
MMAMMAAGCATAGRTGALTGGGIGALAGQAIGRDTKSTLIGAAVGTGLGYMIGNEADKKHATELSQTSQASDYTHDEVGPLGGTRWQLVSLAPQDRVPPYASKLVEFRPQGRVVTTTTTRDGAVDVVDERYRVVEDTLIVNKPGYIINARFGISGDQLIVSADDFRAVLKRIR